MSNIDELPDLAGDVRDRAVPPPYEQVTRRVRARRLRTATGTMAAVVITVGGIAVWQNVATTASPSPAPPITQPADPAYPASPAWRQVVDGTDSHPFEIQGTDDGSIAVVWRALEHPEPTFALVIREPDGTVHGRRLDSPVSLTPVPGGWVGLRTERAWFIAADGTWNDLGSPGPSRQPQRGDVFVNGQFGQWLYSPQDRTWSTLPMPYGDRADGHVTPNGDLVTCGADHQGTVRVFMGEQQQGPDLPGDTCVIEGNGWSVLVAALGDDANGDIPLESGLWSRDAGNSWQDPGLPAMSSISGLAVLADGSWAVSSTEGVLRGAPYLDDAWDEGSAGQVFAAGTYFCYLTFGDDHGPVTCRNRNGDQPFQMPLPGIESSEE